MRGRRLAALLLVIVAVAARPSLPAGTAAAPRHASSPRGAISAPAANPTHRAVRLKPDTTDSRRKADATDPHATDSTPDQPFARPPHDYGVAVILLGAADRVVPRAQVDPLRDAVRRFLLASALDTVDKPKADVEFAGDVMQLAGFWGDLLAR